MIIVYPYSCRAYNYVELQISPREQIWGSGVWRQLRKIPAAGTNPSNHSATIRPTASSASALAGPKNSRLPAVHHEGRV